MYYSQLWTPVLTLSLLPLPPLPPLIWLPHPWQAPTGLSRTSSHCRDFMDTPRGPEGMSGGPGTRGSTSSSSSSNSSSSSSYTPLRPEEGPKEKQEAPEAEYLTSRCVLFTYYQGDISSVVDEHFSRALSSYMDGEGKRRASEQQGTGMPHCTFIKTFFSSFSSNAKHFWE